jgi:hypothetical protein
LLSQTCLAHRKIRMNRLANPNEDKVDLQIQQNVTNWQANNNPLAPLRDEQLDIIYQVGDLIKNQFSEEVTDETGKETKDQTEVMPEIDTNRAYIKWMIACENEIKHENLKEYQSYYETLCDQGVNCEKLYNCVSSFLIFKTGLIHNL